MDESTSTADATTQAPPHDDPGAGGAPHGGREGIDGAHLRDYRSLRRSSTDRKIAGVAGGLARHLDIDPLVVRVVLVVLIFFSGAGLLLYGALWLLVPEESDGSTILHTEDNTRNALLVIALVVGALIAFSTGLGNDSGGVWFLCLVLIAALGWYLTRQQRGPDASAEVPTTSGAPGVSPGPPPASSTTPSTARMAAPSGTTADAGAGWEVPPPPPPPGSSAPAWQPPPARPRRRRGGPLLLWPTLALVAIGWGILGLLDASGYEVPDAGFAALALAVTGAMLALGSVFGRAGGLVLVALLSLIALAGTDVAEPTYSGSRDLVVTPDSVTELADRYSVPAGRIVIDLSELSEPSALDGQTIRADVNAGEIVVILPDGVAADLDAEIRYGGAIDTPDAVTRDGWNVTLTERYGDTAQTDAVVDLDLDAGFGHIDLRSS